MKTLAFVVLVARIQFISSQQNDLVYGEAQHVPCKLKDIVEVVRLID